MRAALEWAAAVLALAAVVVAGWPWLRRLWRRLCALWWRSTWVRHPLDLIMGAIGCAIVLVVAVLVVAAAFLGWLVWRRFTS